MPNVQNTVTRVNFPPVSLHPPGTISDSKNLDNKISTKNLKEGKQTP
jgi:flagella basal body P-ring formation protein FlgA